MTPAHIPVFVPQKPSTKRGIHRPENVFLAWSDSQGQYLFSEEQKSVWKDWVVLNVGLVTFSTSQQPEWYMQWAGGPWFGFIRPNKRAQRVGRQGITAGPDNTGSFWLKSPS